MTSLEPNPHPVTHVPAKTADITLQANVDMEPDVARVTLPRVDVTGVIQLPEEVKALWVTEYQPEVFSVSEDVLSAIRTALVSGSYHANDLLEVWKMNVGASKRMTTRLLETLSKEIEQMEDAIETIDGILDGKEQPTNTHE